jgi:hypothetical protein
MANPNPKNKFQKGHARVAGAGRPPGATNILTRDIKTLIREAAANTGFMEKVPVLDPSGKPTGQYEYRWGKDGELGYLEWLARNHPGHFASLYGRLVPLDVNQKSETKTVVRYETVEERRQAMIAKGWSPAVLAAMEAAMEPKFIQEQRRKDELRAGSRRPDGGVGTLLAGLAGLGTYFLASPGCSRELALLAFGKLAERVDLIAFVETGAGDVVEDGHLLGASYIAGDGAPPFAGLYGDVGHERFQVLILRT